MKLQLKGLKTYKCTTKQGNSELNNEIVNKKMINKIKLKNDDKIEIVHFMVINEKTF